VAPPSARLARPGLVTFTDGPGSISAIVQRTTRVAGRCQRSRFGDAVLLVFFVAQVCDGVCTYVGVHAFGAGIEANPIVAWYIAGLGVGTALIAVKGLAFSCAALLHFLAWHRTIAALAALYAVAAVVPWLTLLLSSAR
jgi:hypothetical protein